MLDDLRRFGLVFDEQYAIEAHITFFDAARKAASAYWPALKGGLRE
jgi:hypothetical protein